MLTVHAVLMAAVGKSEKIATGKVSKKEVLYTGIGPSLTHYDVDVVNATLTERDSLTLPGAISETAFHPTKKYLYSVWGNIQVTPRTHGISAFSIDPNSGALTPYGESAPLPSGPGYVSYATTDVTGTHLMACLTDPAYLTVYQIMPDGTIGPEVKQAGHLDFGNHPHQVRIDPSNKTVILMTRGDAPTANRPENPGALKVFSYDDGVIANIETIAPNQGFGYQVRHLDFHPSGKWVFVTLEAQQKLLVYQRNSDGTLNPNPLFSEDTLDEPSNVRKEQMLGTVHVDHAGKFLYVANRASGSTKVDGKNVFIGGENSIVVFAINQSTGEPTKIQSIDTRGLHPRTISLDPSGKILVAHNIHQLYVKDGDGVKLLPPNLAVFRVGIDGKLTFVRKYDVAVGTGNDWMGITSLP
jgi:6-phosphogluconolactonase